MFNSYFLFLTISLANVVFCMHRLKITLFDLTPFNTNNVKTYTLVTLFSDKLKLTPNTPLCCVTLVPKFIMDGQTAGKQNERKIKQPVLYVFRNTLVQKPITVSMPSGTAVNALSFERTQCQELSSPMPRKYHMVMVTVTVTVAINTARLGRYTF